MILYDTPKYEDKRIEKLNKKQKNRTEDKVTKQNIKRNETISEIV